MQSDIYTDIETVARAYGVSQETVRRWCRDGIIKGAIKARRDWRIPKRYETGTVALDEPQHEGNQPHDEQ